ncbi:DUF7940 domain-containing protein [Acinetobacter sp. ANC 5502]
MKLIDNVQHWHKFWSIRLSALGAFLMSVELAYGAQITLWWQTSAHEYFPFLNPFVIKWIGLLLVVAGIGARIIKQEKAHGG